MATMTTTAAAVAIPGGRGPLFSQQSVHFYYEMTGIFMPILAGVFSTLWLYQYIESLLSPSPHGSSGAVDRPRGRGFER